LAGRGGRPARSAQPDRALVNSSNKILGRTPIFVKGTKSFKATLPAGTYTFYCSVPGHRQAGMEGKLTITGSTP
jgi:plastocyanin